MYSICATSGPPEPALIAVCNFWYSAGPPALLTWTLMSG